MRYKFVKILIVVAVGGDLKVAFFFLVYIFHHFKKCSTMTNLTFIIREKMCSNWSNASKLYSLRPILIDAMLLLKNLNLLKLTTYFIQSLVNFSYKAFGLNIIKINSQIYIVPSSPQRISYSLLEISYS